MLKHSIRLAWITLMLVWLGGCATLGEPTEPPRVTLSNLKMIDAQLFEQRYALTLRIQNPNSFDLDVNGLSFEVELNGREFAHGVSNKGVLIPAYGESTLEVGVTSSLFNIVDQINALERRQGKSLEYRIHGKISTANHLLSLSFERKGEIGGANSRYSD